MQSAKEKVLDAILYSSSDDEELAEDEAGYATLYVLARQRGK